MRRSVRKALFYALLLVLAVPFVFPFWWMVTSSLKSAHEIFAYPPRLVPAVWQWQNLIEIFTYQPFARHYFNSVYIALLVTIGTIAVASLAGYAFARIRFPGKGIIFLLLLSTLMMPTEVTIIPNFQIMKALGLVNTHVPLILIPIAGAAGIMGTFLMRQFFLGLPRELEEAAMIDGLGRPGIFWYIALPLARPALASLAVLTFLASWNSFLEPLVYLNELDLFTLPLSLRNFADAYGLPVWHLQLAATSLSVIPILVVFALAQRAIVDSFAHSGLKG